MTSTLVVGSDGEVIVADTINSARIVSLSRLLPRYRLASYQPTEEYRLIGSFALYV